MRKTIALLICLAAMFALIIPSSAATWTDPETGYSWSYRINGDMAEIFNYSNVAVSPSPSGSIIIPSMLGGKPVRSIADYAFQNCNGLTNVTIPSSVTNIGIFSFYGCTGLTNVSVPDSVTCIGWCAFENTPFYENQPDGLVVFGKVAYMMKGECPTKVIIPNSVESIAGYAFYNCTGLTSVTIGNNVMNIGMDAFYNCEGLKTVYFMGYRAGLLSDIFQYGYLSRGVLLHVSRNCAAVFLKDVGISGFSGYVESANLASVEILSSSIRENDPTIMDVVYKVTSSKSNVKVRVLAFEDGERSFAKVVRPETFIDGTEVNVGDNIAANVEHTISWRVSSDWTTKLAKVKFEVLACEGDLLPLELMTIPASDQYGKMKISWNAISDAQLFDALLWLTASKDSALSFSSGVLRANGTNVAQNTGFANNTQREAAASFIFGKMGCQRMTGAILNYANQETRLGLSPSGSRQYAYKMVP